MQQPLTLIESLSETRQSPDKQQNVPQFKQSKLNIARIRKEIEAIKQEGQQRKRQLHEQFSYSFDQGQTLPQRQHNKMMSTIRERVLKKEYETGPTKTIDSNKNIIKKRYDNPEETLRRPHHIGRGIKFNGVQTERKMLHVSLQRQISTKRELVRLPIRKPLVKCLSTKLQAEQYIKNLLSFRDLYESLMCLIKCVRSQTTVIQKNINRYVLCVNGNQLAFIDDFISQLDVSSAKNVKFSRALENLTVLYLALETIERGLNETSSHLVNLIGHAAANVILMARLFILCHRFLSNRPEKTPFEESMEEFQKQSYGGQLTDYEQILTRLQHNNDILFLVDGKVGKHNPQFQVKVKQFIKSTIQRGNYNSAQCFYFLFEYFACYLHTMSLTKVLPKLDTSPMPFLPISTKPYTLIIDPENVLTYQKNEKLFLRSYTHQFIDFVDSYCEIVFWTQHLPEAFIPILQIIDPDNKAMHKLYRYHCQHRDQDSFGKDLRKLGRNLEHVLILDSLQSKYEATPFNGIVVNWTGSKRDRKLMDLTQILTEVFKQKMTIMDMLETFTAELDALVETPKKARFRRRIH